MPRKKKPGRKAPNHLTIVYVAPLPVRYVLALDKWLGATNHKRFMRDRERNIAMNSKAGMRQLTARLLMDTLIKRSGVLRAERARELTAKAKHALRVEIGTGVGFKSMSMTKALTDRVRRYICTSERDPSRAILLAYLLRGWLEARGYVTNNTPYAIPIEDVDWAYGETRDELEI